MSELPLAHMAKDRTPEENAIERVWYCPECDGLHVQSLNQAALFRAEYGPFIMMYELNGSFKTHNFYYVGDL